MLKNNTGRTHNCLLTSMNVNLSLFYASSPDILHITVHKEAYEETLMHTTLHFVKDSQGQNTLLETYFFTAGQIASYLACLNSTGWPI